jgi:hypothetical protein
LLFAAAAILAASPSNGDELLSVVAHIHTRTSGGDFSPEEIAARLAAEGLDVGIVTDHDRLEIQWGVPLLRHFLRYTYRRRSIATDGAVLWTEAVRKASRAPGGPLLVPGIEANPYYRVELDWDARRIRVHRLHEHVLAFGFPDRDVLRSPSIAHGFGTFPRDAVAFGGAALALALAVAVALRRRGEIQLRTLRVRLRGRFPGRAIALAVGGILAADAVALRASRLDQYGPDAGPEPFQRFIDWVDRRGGLTFWAHPGLREVLRLGPFEVVTPPYFDHLSATDGYTGFGSAAAAVVGPGGFWDALLQEYCSGRRRRAPWFLAQADYRTGPASRLAASVNWVRAADRTEGAVLEALDRGRFYATLGGAGRRWRLSAFHLVDLSGRSATSGERLLVSGRLALVARLERFSRSDRPLRIALVRGGEIVLDRTVLDSQDLRFEDSPPPAACTYYRLVGFEGTRPALIANPIFVEPSPP